VAPLSDATSTSRSAGYRRERTGVGRRADSLFAFVAAACGSLVLVILGFMIVSTTATAMPIFRSQGWYFVFGSNWDPNVGKFGILPFIFGTVVTSAIALVIAVPLSLGIALFLTEVAPRRLAGVVAYGVDLLAAVPSVVFGLWGVFVLLPYFLQPVAKFLSTYLGFIPLFAAPSSGISFFGAGVILSIMIVPIISALTREVFRVIPRDDRNAAYALGATRWEMIRGVVLPGSRAGIVAAVMLGLGRALGETIAVALLIGSRPEIVASIFKPGYSMASVIANQFSEAGPDHIRALVGVGVVLFGLTILVNVAARALIWRAVEQ
jgi:phosphate transport system permease protein